MKNLYFSLSLYFFSIATFGQIVNIPDANFKNALVATNSVILQGQPGYTDADTNNDSEIEVSEAMMVLEINVINTNIGSLIGISSFSNVHRLWCDNNYLQELSLVGLSQISDLGFSNNQLTNIDLSELNLLRSLYCNNNQLSTLHLPSSPIYPSLILNCSNNQLTSLDLNGFEVYALDISNNNLTDIEIPYTPFCEYLTISGNQFDTISIAAGEILEMYCINTQVVHLDLSLVDKFHYNLQISDNQYLTSINLKNNNADFCYDYPGDENGGPEICPFSAYVNNNPTLNLICVDDLSRFNFAQGILVSEAEYYASIVNDPNVIFSTACLLGTSQNELLGKINMYPNPAKNTVNIEIASGVILESIAIYNPLGQLVKTLTDSELSASLSIDVSALKTGSYFMEITSNNGKITKKFVKL